MLHPKTAGRLGGTQAIPINARLIAATNRDLEALLKEGKFREVPSSAHSSCARERISRCGTWGRRSKDRKPRPCQGGEAKAAAKETVYRDVRGCISGVLLVRHSLYFKSDARM